MTEIKRKGAKSTKDIPKDIIDQLNNGEIETANLVEWLAVDQKKLLQNLLNQLGKEKYLKPILTRIDNLKKQTVNTINEAIGTELFTQILRHKDSKLLKQIAIHPSDIVRVVGLHIISVKM